MTKEGGKTHPRWPKRGVKLIHKRVIMGIKGIIFMRKIACEKKGSAKDEQICLGCETVLYRSCKLWFNMTKLDSTDHSERVQSSFGASLKTSKCQNSNLRQLWELEEISFIKLIPQVLKFWSCYQSKLFDWSSCHDFQMLMYCRSEPVLHLE